MRLTACLLGYALLAGCGQQGSPEVTSAEGRAASAGSVHETALTEEARALVNTLDEARIEVLAKPWTGDLDGMLERRVVRVLVVPTQTHYFINNGRAQGIAAEMVRAFETQLNKRHKPDQRHLRTQVLFVPTTRDDLIPALEEGRGDLAVAALTITPGRQARADFSEPYLRDVSEIVVTGPAGPELTRLEDLAGREVNVRPSSSLRLHGFFHTTGEVTQHLRPVFQLHRVTQARCIQICPEPFLRHPHTVFTVNRYGMSQFKRVGSQVRGCHDPRHQPHLQRLLGIYVAPGQHHLRSR